VQIHRAIRLNINKDPFLFSLIRDLIPIIIKMIWAIKKGMDNSSANTPMIT